VKGEGGGEQTQSLRWRSLEEACDDGTDVEQHPESKKHGDPMHNHNRGIEDPWPIVPSAVPSGCGPLPSRHSVFPCDFVKPVAEFVLPPNGVRQTVATTLTKVVG